ncbi:MAG: hypothetical protein NZM26_03865 [Patescibacteria group bacterium]|nr:hypothetical protein [Patescibacteria group bacterium]
MGKNKFIGVFDIPSLALDIFLANWKKYAVLGGLNVIPSLFFILGQSALQLSPEIDFYVLFKEHNINAIIFLICTFIGQMLVYIITSVAILVLTKEKNLTVKQSIAKTLKIIFPIFFAGLLTFLIILGGYVLLIVPGIIFSVWYLYVLPCVIDGKRGTQALAHSKSLVKGRFWQTLTRIVITSLIVAITGHAIELPFVFFVNITDLVVKNTQLASIISIFGESLKFTIIIPLAIISLYILYESANQTYANKKL